MENDNSGEMPKWRSSDTVWMLSLYGTAIGAGVLFLPINAASGGLIPLLVMAVLAFPMTFLSHRALCRFVLSGNATDITVVVEKQFGKHLGYLITVLYCFSLYPILLMYSVSLTNTIESFIQYQLHFPPPPRSIISFLLIALLMLVVQFGEMLIVNVMSALVYPFIAILMIISLSLIPQWTGEIFENISLSGAVHQGGSGLMLTLWLLIPVTVFSFNHSPIISSLAVAKTKEYGELAEQKCSQIIKYSNILMVVTVLFFVFSCALCLTPENLQEAKIQNVSILSYLANHFHTPFLSWVAPVVALVAMCKSFLGHYLGAKEGIHGVVIKTFKFADIHIQEKSRALHICTITFIFITAWLVSIYNPNILTLIQSISGPLFALLLFLMPMYAIHTVPALAKYKGKKSNIFVTIIGLIATSAAIYQFFS